MRSNILNTFTALLIIFFICSTAFAEMQSSNYTISASVFSSGGAQTGSGNFQTDSTLGQSTPLTDPADPPYSDSYELYPGFWNAVAKITLFCSGDDDLDNDVDGLDLEAYIFDDGGLGLDVFAANFGKEVCP